MVGGMFLYGCDHHSCTVLLVVHLLTDAPAPRSQEKAQVRNPGAGVMVMAVPLPARAARRASVSVVRSRRCFSGATGTRGTAAFNYKMEIGSSGARDSATATTRLLSAEAVVSYHDQGFWVEKGLFDKEEAATLLENASAGGSTINSQAVGVEDASGRLTKLSLFNTPGVNVFGAVSRTARVVDNVELLLAGWSHGEQRPEEVYHYHSKVRYQASCCSPDTISLTHADVPSIVALCR